MNEARVFGGEPVIEFAAEHDRRTFLKWAGIIGVGGTLAAATAGRFASAQSDQGDIDILNYALTLEYLEADFYSRGIDAGVLSGEELALVRPIRDHEEAHVSTISSTLEDLGATPVEEPKFKYPSGTFGDRKAFLDTAYTFETLGVKAYHGQVVNFKDTALLAAAASIAGTESRHTAVLADLTGRDPFPAPLEARLSMSKVLKAAKPFIQS